MDKLPYIALAYAWVLIYVPRQIMSREMAKLDGGYDNNNPRAQQAQLEGRGRRATGAHLNGFEAFAPFAAALLAAIQRGANRDAIAIVALAFCVARTVYVWAYLEDKASARSGAWGLGMLATAALAGLAIAG
jgi:uncharacterized MAPEG superfamily protein